MISIESFGWRHPGALDLVKGDVLVFDLSDKLHDPNVAGSPLQHMTGLDDEVFDHVMATDGARGLFADIANQVIALHHAGRGNVRVLIACRGGRHRSVVAAREVARLVGMWADDPIRITHHHVSREVLPPASDDARTYRDDIEKDGRPFSDIWTPTRESGEERVG